MRPAWADHDGAVADAVVGRSGSVYKAWLNNQPEELIDGIDHRPGSVPRLCQRDS